MMWVLASLLLIGILSAIAWKDRARLADELADELDQFLAEVLA